MKDNDYDYDDINEVASFYENRNPFIVMDVPVFLRVCTLSLPPLTLSIVETGGEIEDSFHL